MDAGGGKECGCVGVCEWDLGGMEETNLLPYSQLCELRDEKL